MGREGEWSASGQYPPRSQQQQQQQQPSGYPPQAMQSYPGVSSGQYAPGSASMQPAMRAPPSPSPPGPPPSSQYGNAAPPSRPPGPPPYGSAPPGVRPQWAGPAYGTAPPGARPQWAGPAAGPVARPSPASGPPGPPPNAGPLGQSPLANQSFRGPPLGGPPPAAGPPPQLRPQGPPSTPPQQLHTWGPPPPTPQQLHSGQPHMGGPPLQLRPQGPPPPTSQQLHTWGPPPPTPQQLHTAQPHMPGGLPPSMQAMSQPGSPAGGQPGSASRIDPNQIPRPQSTTSPLEFDTRVNGSANLPPSATTNFVVRDTGNCSPRYIRCTLNQIPCSGDLLSNSGMPLAVMVQPLALPDPTEEPIQIVDFGESGPVRCSAPHCKAYINPFMRFIDQGRRFICNLCGYTSETPRDYLCNLGPDGRRRDADMRPELARGTVEFVAPKEYMVRPPMPQVFFFLVDVSVNAVSQGAVASACSAINRVLADLGDDPRTLVGIATYDSTVHFYNLNKNLQSPSMLVVPDIQDVYTPRQTDLLVPLTEVRDRLEQLLETIPSMFQNSRIPESGFGAAVKGAYLAMKATGGKLLVFQTVLPSVGFGALSARESEGKINEKEAQKLLQPSDKMLRTMALELAEFQVCVDLFLTTQNYVDIASLAVISRSTGGQIYYYHEFQANVDSTKLYNDLRWNVTRPQGLECVMRVRCSNGLQVQDYYGNFCKRNPTDVDLPAIDCDKTIMVTLKHDDKFQDNAECCFQSALLYTTTTGQRRIRLNTLSLSCTTALMSLFRGADLDAQFTHFLKQAAQDITTTPVAQERERMSNQCVNILYTYRKFCANASSSGQLILPEALKLLPLYTMALTKCVGLRTDVRIDERSYWLTRAASLSASLAIPLVYPRMFSVHNLPSKEDLGGAILPPTLSLSSENLEHDGVYLLENGEDAMLYVNSQASREVLYQLFGVHSIEELLVGPYSLQEYDNELSRRLNEVVNEIRRQRCSYLRLRLLKRLDPRELLFLNYLVEDKAALGLSYVEYLVQTHRQIQNRMN